MNVGDTPILYTPIEWQEFPDLESKAIEKLPEKNLNSTFFLSQSNVYDNHFGFFCKVEVKLEKTTKMSMRFRLGGLDYVNGLEGK